MDSGLPRDKRGRFVKKSEALRRKRASEHIVKLNHAFKSQRLAAKGKEEETEPVYDPERQVSDISLIANTMWCSVCDQRLNFRGVENEIQQEFASVRQIRCTQCSLLVKVQISLSLKSEDGTEQPL